MTSVSNVSSSTPAPAPVNPTVTRANNALKMLMTSTDVVQALSQQSSLYVPPTSKQIVSTLLALFDTNNSSYITAAGVQQAVVAEGGKPSDATALWSQLDPTNKGSISAGDFVTNNFLAQQITANTPALLATVKSVQQINPGTSGSVLDAFSNANADVLSSSFNGSSPVGGPGSDNQKINIFL